jgi:RNA polymerase sigma factor (sigma-70 family)
MKALRLIPLDEAVGTLRLAPRDTGAWEQVFSITWPYVLALAQLHLYGPQRRSDAEDLAQEVFFRLGRAWHSRQIDVRDGSALRALLAVMTKRLALDRVRQQHRVRRDLSKETPVDEARDVRDPANPESEIEWRDLLRKVSGQLADDERKVLEMRIQGYEIGEIATRLHLSTRTIDRKLLLIKAVLQCDLGIDR